MNKFLMSLAALFGAFCSAAVGGEMQEISKMRLKLSFDNKEVIVKMYDNSASQQVINLAPTEFEFSDFAGKEKVTNFRRPLSLTEAPRGMVAKAGKMFIYAPWGNMGFFYKDAGVMNDTNLIPLGEVETGLEYLAGQKGNFTAKLERVE